MSVRVVTKDETARTKLYCALQMAQLLCGRMAISSYDVDRFKDEADSYRLEEMLKSITQAEAFIPLVSGALATAKIELINQISDLDKTQLKQINLSKQPAETTASVGEPVTIDFNADDIPF